MWRDFFYFSRGERRAIVFLIMLAVLLYHGAHVAEHFHPHPEPASPDAELERFQAEVKIRESRKEAEYASARNWQKEEEHYTLFPFDPNKADSATLRQLGIPVYVVRNILKYRERGGTFRSEESLAKIYGLAPTLFQRLKPYIRVEERESFTPLTASAKKDSALTPSLIYIKQEKYDKGTKLCLNTADTTELKKIPGIGSGNAARILNFRKRMGGFYSVSQLSEVNGLPDSLKQWFFISTPPQRNIKINRWGVERLRSHPYLSFYQAKVIVEHRHKYGKIEDLSQLEMYEEFSSQDLIRLKDYIDYE